MEPCIQVIATAGLFGIDFANGMVAGVGLIILLDVAISLFKKYIHIGV